MTPPVRETHPPSPSEPGRSAPEPLWRDLAGRVLRRHRLERGERLAETALRAGISTQYLSEVERGRKDASSEVVAAVAGALGLSLLDLTMEVARDLHGHLRVADHVGSRPGLSRPAAEPMTRAPRALALVA